MISSLIDRPENQSDTFKRLTSHQLTKHKMKTMAVAIEILCLKVSLVLLGGALKTHLHDMREVIFAFVHDLRL